VLAAPFVPLLSKPMAHRLATDDATLRPLFGGPAHGLAQEAPCPAVYASDGVDALWTPITKNLAARSVSDRLPDQSPRGQAGADASQCLPTQINSVPTAHGAHTKSRKPLFIRILLSNPSWAQCKGGDRSSSGLTSRHPLPDASVRYWLDDLQIRQYPDQGRRPCTTDATPCLPSA
jgi:hypothetical protein